MKIHCCIHCVFVFCADQKQITVVISWYNGKLFAIETNKSLRKKNIVFFIFLLWLLGPILLGSERQICRKIRNFSAPGYLSRIWGRWITLQQSERISFIVLLVRTWDVFEPPTLIGMFCQKRAGENSFPGRLADLNIRMFNLYRIVDCQNCLTFLDLFSLVLFLLSIWQCDQEWNVKFVYRWLREVSGEVVGNSLVGMYWRFFPWLGLRWEYNVIIFCCFYSQNCEEGLVQLVPLRFCCFVKEIVIFQGWLFLWCCTSSSWSQIILDLPYFVIDACEAFLAFFSFRRRQ